MKQTILRRDNPTHFFKKKLEHQNPWIEVSELYKKMSSIK